jgi:hypothetical protein
MHVPTRTSVVAVVAVLVAVLTAVMGCTHRPVMGPPDASVPDVRAEPPADGPLRDVGLDAQRDHVQRDYVQPDESLCYFDDTLPCDLELSHCTTLGNMTDECGGLDCVKAPFEAPIDKMCLRRCDCTDACQEGTFCLPKSLSQYVVMGFATMGGHCFRSFCGGAADPEAWYGNGLLLGSCELGADAYLKTTFTDKKPGTCNPTETVPTSFGQCLEAGSAIRGSACPMAALSGQCQVRTNPYATCRQGTLCVGTEGASYGECVKLCAPHSSGFNPTVYGSCAADSDFPTNQYCSDTSSYTVDEQTWNMTTTYIGYCSDDRGCDLLSPGDDCAGTGRICSPTNPWSSYGSCTGIPGTVAVGNACTASATAPAAESCVQGSVCVDAGASPAGTCRALCGREEEAPKKPCAGGYSCYGISLNDWATVNWGTCLPAPDGG